MVKIIINADDLGKDYVVNNAIEEALTMHYITSSTIMANSTTWDQIHKIVNNHPDASFGVHLNLTEGKALTNNPILFKYGIVDKANIFTKKIVGLIDCNQELLEAIFEEWDAQMNKVIYIEGIEISHIDGHHHIHTLAPLLPILIRLIKKYKIDKVRNRYEFTFPWFKTIIIRMLKLIPIGEKLRKSLLSIDSFPFLFLGTLYDNKFWREEVNKVAKTTDIFNAYETQIHLCKNNAVIQDNCVIELMCHPGHPQFEHEYNQIKEEVLSSLVKDIKYINYRDI